MVHATLLEQGHGQQSPQLFNSVISLVLLSIGSLVVAYSIYVKSSIFAFIGLTLVFWGLLFLFVLPEKIVKKEVMEVLSSSTARTIGQILSELALKGKAVYLPFQRELYRKYNLDFQSEFIYIPKKNEELRETITQAFIKSGEGLRIRPTGLELADLIMKKSRKNLQNLDLVSLTDVLAPIITRELGIAKDFEMEVKENIAITRIIGPITQELCRDTEHLLQNVGCPMCSSIACILTRITAKPLTIEKCFLRNNVIEAQFHIQELTT